MYWNYLIQTNLAVNKLFNDTDWKVADNTTHLFFKIWANPGLFLFIFVRFSLQFQYKMKKSGDDVLGIQTRGRRKVGADKTTELWQPPHREIVESL